MTKKRLNISIDEDIMNGMDALSESYGMNRSEFIEFLYQVYEEINVGWILENIVLDDLIGEDGYDTKITKYKLLKAARKVEIRRS